MFIIKLKIYFFFKKFVTVMEIFNEESTGKNSGGSHRDVFDVFLVKFEVIFF